MSSQYIELYAIRHAESAANTNHHLIGGRSNETPLTEKGIEQANRLGRYFIAKNIFPDFIYSSPAVRTLQTAEHVLNEMGVYAKPTIHEGLQELDQGFWVGRNRIEVYTQDVLDEIQRRGKDFKAEGGESMNEAGRRMLKTASEIADNLIVDEDKAKLFFFGHGVAIRCLASAIHNWSHKQTYETEIPNASATLFTRRSGEWALQEVGVGAE